MAIAMICKYVDVICDNSLRSIYINGKKMGYQFDIRLSYYRGHFLSIINELALRTDGEEVLKKDITFCLHGKELGIAQLSEANTEFWPILEPATIKVHKNGGIPEGEHELDFTLIFRSPYMPIGEGEYMPWNSSEKKILILSEIKGGQNNE